jgi:transcriptional regulator with XRE-family HTH domain
VPSAPTSSSAWQVRRELGARLGEIRRDAGLTGRALARLCGWHESKVSRIENAVTAPASGDIRSWCEHCGAADQVADLVASLRAVEGMYVEWRRMERTGLRRAQQAVLPLWERTRLFRAYSSWLVPGAVQTQQYTRAVLGAIGARRGLPDDVDDAVAARTDRLRLLRERDRLFEILVEEPVLRTTIGGAEVMRGQLSHLIDVASWPAVSLGIIPTGIDRDLIWPVEDFWIFDDALVNVELVSGLLTITRPGELAAYDKAFRDLSAMAVRGAGARALIASAIDALP